GPRRIAEGHPRRGVHQRGQRPHDRRRRQPPAARRAAKGIVTRLWDKGAPLDERVLGFTAGEDYALDERLVPYDVRASIAHAEMLHGEQLLSDADLAAIPTSLSQVRAQHPRRARPLDPADH